MSARAAGRGGAQAAAGQAPAEAASAVTGAKAIMLLGLIAAIKATGASLATVSLVDVTQVGAFFAKVGLLASGGTPTYANPDEQDRVTGALPLIENALASYKIGVSAADLGKLLQALGPKFTARFPAAA